MEKNGESLSCLFLARAVFPDGSPSVRPSIQCLLFESGRGRAGGRGGVRACVRAGACTYWYGPQTISDKGPIQTGRISRRLVLD